MNNKTTNFMHYFFNFSAYFIAYPFYIAIGVFPILLIIMGLTGTEDLLEAVIFLGVITIAAFSILLSLSVLKVVKREFYDRKGVSSWKEYYNQYMSKEAKEIKRSQEEQRLAKGKIQFQLIDTIFQERREKAPIVEPELSYLIASTNIPKKEFKTSDIKLVIASSIIFVIALLSISAFLFFSIDLPLNFWWAFIFFEGMVLSLYGTSRSSGTPFKPSRKSTPHFIKRLLFRERASEVDFKIFLLLVGVILVTLSVVIFVIQELYSI